MSAPLYRPHNSPIHRIHPAVKLVTVLGLILLVSLAPVGAYGAYVGLFALTMGAALVALLEPWRVVLRSAIVLPFAGAAAVLLVTGPPPYIEAAIPISQPGLERFASILFKSSIAVQMSTIIIATTRFNEIIAGLAWLRLPTTLTAVLAFAYRYILLLAEEAGRLNRARQARSVARVPLGFRVRTTGRLTGNLLVRTLERSERVGQAMAARGGGAPPATRLEAPSALEWAAAGALLAAAGALVLL